MKLFSKGINKSGLKYFSNSFTKRVKISKQLMSARRRVSIDFIDIKVIWLIYHFYTKVINA